MTAGQLASIWALLLVCGCGAGAAEPAKAPAGEPAAGESAEPSAKPADEPSAKPADEAAGGGSASESAGGKDEAASTTLEGKDLESVLQTLLSDAELLDHLHLKLAGRSPLKVSGPNLPQKLAVIAGSHEVKVVTEEGSKKAPVLVFTKIERTGKQAKLHYRYDIEGLEGRATFNLKDGHWELGANRVVEK